MVKWLWGWNHYYDLPVPSGYAAEIFFPCIGTGIAVGDNGGKDFREKRIKENKPRNSGAYEVR